MGLNRVGSIFYCSYQVGLGLPFLVWVWFWKISPKNPKYFNCFPIGSKKYRWVESKSTLVKDRLAPYLNAQVGSGQCPSLIDSASFLLANYLEWIAQIFSSLQHQVSKFFLGDSSNASTGDSSPVIQKFEKFTMERHVGNWSKIFNLW